MNEHYRKAQVAYDHAMEDLEEIGVAIRRVAEKNGRNFSTKIFYSQFDCILQYSLIQAAASDGDIDVDELQCIKDLTRYGDLVSFINSKYAVKISWQSILDSNTGSVIDWLDINKRYVDSICDEFCPAFSIVDAATEKDYLKNLMEDVRKIIIAIWEMDDVVYESEVENISDNYILEVFATIHGQINELTADADKNVTKGQTK